MSAVEGRQDGGLDGAHDRQGEAERTGFVQSAEQAKICLL